MANVVHILYAPVDNIYCDFHRPGKRCLRYGVGRTIAKRRESKGPSIPWPEHCINLVQPSERMWIQAQVYRVQLSDEFHERWPNQPKNFYIVAMHDGAVESYLKKRYGNLFKRYAGMARYALDTAMKQTSTRNVNPEKVSGKAKAKAESLVRVYAGGLGVFTVRVEDNLRYAAAALRQGSSGVSYAMMKAANSVAGRIRAFVAKYSLEVTAPPTPFPEIAEHRKTA